MNKDKIIALRIKMYKEIDIILRNTEQEILKLKEK